MVLKLYIDHGSQPSRAVLAFCKFNQIEHEIIETRIFTGDSRKEEFLKTVNSEGQVPAIVDDGFALAESHAILRYLHTTRKC